MAEQVGEIFIEVDAKTAGLVSAVKTVDSSSKRMGKSLDWLDGRMVKMNKTTKAVKGGLGGMSRSAGQVGIQFQQLVGQIQGGQNAMQAVAMQAADIGIVMGAPLIGAIAGLSAAFASALVPSLFDSKSAAEQLEKQMESIEGAFKIAKDGTVELTDEMKALAGAQIEVAQARLGIAQAGAANVIRDATDAIKDQAGELTNTMTVASQYGQMYRSRISPSIKDAAEQLKNFDESLDIDQLSEATINSGKLNRQFDTLAVTSVGLQRSLGLTAQQTIPLINALAEVERTKSPDAIAGLESTVANLRNELGENASPELDSFISGLSEIFDIARKAGGVIKTDINTALVEFSEKAKEANKNVKDLIDGLKEQAATAGLSERETAKLIATWDGATPAQIALIDKLYDQIEAQEKLEEAQKKQTAEQKKAAAEQQKAVSTYNNLKEKITEQILEIQDGEAAFEMYIEKQRRMAMEAGFTGDQIEKQIRKLRELKEEQDRQRETEQFRTGLQRQVSTGLGLSQEDQIRGQAREDLGALDLARAEGLLAGEQDYQNRRVAIIEDAEKRIRELQEKTKDEQLLNWEAIGNQAVGALAGIATGAQDGREAMRGLAISIAQQAVGALLKMAVAGVTAQTSQASAAAATGAAIAAAYAPAATAANIASFGGAALAAAGTAPIAGAATQAAMQFGGGRLHGGPVGAGRMYEVGEGGKPELLQQGNKNYLIPGNNGNVVSNRDMQGMGGSTVVNNINVINNGSASVDVRERQNNQGGADIDIIVADINNRGRIHKAITSTTTANNKTS